MPSGYFRFNFKEISKELIILNKYRDTFFSNLAFNNINSFTKEQVGGYLVPTIYFEVKLSDGTIQKTQNQTYFKLIQSLSTLEDYKYSANYGRNFFLLLPIVNNNMNQYFIKYWKGYPLDFVFFSATNNLQLKSNNETFTFQRKANLTRLVISDGETSLEQINDQNTNSFILEAGIKSFKIFENNISNSQEIIIQTENYCNEEAIYLKWFNAQGGYSYYLFKNFERSINIKNIGELENNFYDYYDDNFVSPKLQIGKEIIDKIKVDSDILSDNEFNLLIGIFSSPRVYFFIGTPNTRVQNNKSWIEVKINTSSLTTRNFKNRPKNIDFVFELPERDNQTL